jgi:hypothetical protein
MSDIENAMRQLRDMITGRKDGLCGRLNRDNQNAETILGYG